MAALNVYGLTFDHTANYGSCLQAYALQTAVEKIRLGENQESCAYHLIPVMLSVVAMEQSTGTMIRRIKKYISRTIIRNWHRRPFVPFERAHMKFAPVTSLSRLDHLNGEADAFVCGSDVIWRPDLNHNLGAFYLDFAKKYKFSYAASFGQAAIDEDLYEEIGRHLSSFDSISVREPSAAEIVRRCTDKPVRVVADPVLLLERSEWERIAEERRKKRPYIFAYMTHTNAEIEGFIDRLAKTTGLPVIRAAWSDRKIHRQVTRRIQSPEEWLAQLRDAQYVVTNSFHATVFSTIFHKKFFTVVHGKKDGGVNVRMWDYLNRIGLQDRMFSSVPETFDLGEIDFSQPDAVISGMREEGLRYLQENLEAAWAQKQRKTER